MGTCLPNMMKAVGMAYEYGLEHCSNFWETPGFYIEYSLDESESNKAKDEDNSNSDNSDNNTASATASTNTTAYKLNNQNSQNSTEKKTFKKTSTTKVGKALYEFDLGYLSYAHLTNIRICINNYQDIISEAKIDTNHHIIELLKNLETLENYCDKIQILLGKLNSKAISAEEYIKDYPVLDIKEISVKIQKILENLSQEKSQDNKSSATGKKLLEIFKIFKIKGTNFELILPSAAFVHNNPKQNLYYNILSEAKMINNNGNFVDMIVISDYTDLIEYKKVDEFLNKFDIKGNFDLVPRINEFSRYNETKSKVTFIASSHTRKNDGLLLTELRNLR
jgi:hypothetical protein